MCFSLKPKHRWVVVHLAFRVGTSTGNNPYLDRIYIYYIISFAFGLLQMLLCTGRIMCPKWPCVGPVSCLVHGGIGWKPYPSNLQHGPNISCPVTFVLSLFHVSYMVYFMTDHAVHLDWWMTFQFRGHVSIKDNWRFGTPNLKWTILTQSL